MGNFIQRYYYALLFTFTVQTGLYILSSMFSRDVKELDVLAIYYLISACSFLCNLHIQYMRELLLLIAIPVEPCV